LHWLGEFGEALMRLATKAAAAVVVAATSALGPGATSARALVPGAVVWPMVPYATMDPEPDCTSSGVCMIHTSLCPFGYFCLWKGLNGTEPGVAFPQRAGSFIYRRLPDYFEVIANEAQSWETNGDYSDSNVPDEVWIYNRAGAETCAPDDEGATGTPARGNLPAGWSGQMAAHSWHFSC
jgi:hypothetical protein